MDTKQISDIINLVFQVLMLALPIATVLITWFVRNYVKSANAEKSLAAIAQVSSAAVDYAEDLDKRGELAKYLKLWNVSDDVVNLASDGLKKLNIAGKWAESEFSRQGIKMTDEEAQAWIASEFQKRQRGTGLEQGTTDRIGDAASLLSTLEQSGVISLPADAGQATLLASKVAEWLTTQQNKQSADLQHQEALVQLQAQLTAQPQIPVVPTGPSVEAQLMQLATQSVQYVEQLKAGHRLTLPEVDIALAWVLTEVTKQGLVVTTDQITSSVGTAFQARGIGPET